MANKPTQTTDRPWQVSVKYIAANGLIRSGSLVVYAPDISTAEKLAGNAAQTAYGSNARWTKIKPY